MLEIAQALEADGKKWGEYIDSAPGAHLYHDYRWKKVLEESFGHRCFYLMALGEGKISGVFPLIYVKSRWTKNALVSIPFLNYGGMLANDVDTASFLLDKAIDVSKDTKASYLEVRNLENIDLFPITREHKVTMWLNLHKGADRQWEALDAKVRNQVRKAQKEGLRVETGKKEALSDFYRVYSHNMRDLGTPVLGRNFFENIIDYFSDETNIFIVKLKNEPIAGALTLCHRGTMEIPWASSVRKFNKLCPNEFLYWEAIKHAIHLGCRKFDFGRCTKDTGTYRFKKQWNPEIKQLYWQYWSSKPSNLPAEDPKLSKFAPLIAIWKKLPLFVANKLGPGIAKGIPSF